MGKRYVPRHAAPGKHDAPRKTEQSKERRQTKEQKPRENIRQETARKPRRSAARIILRLALVIVVVLGALLATILLRWDELKGTWALDDTTVYEFDGRGHGALSLPLGSYEFSYSIEDNVLSIDFADAAASDAVYSYSVENAVLTLDTNTGNVYRLVKQE